jgi:Asp-tRNA(Asn)/Glu-tRNA(Gln) amidotransferase C subunit
MQKQAKTIRNTIDNTKLQGLQSILRGDMEAEELQQQVNQLTAFCTQLKTVNPETVDTLVRVIKKVKRKGGD